MPPEVAFQASHPLGSRKTKEGKGVGRLELQEVKAIIDELRPAAKSVTGSFRPNARDANEEAQNESGSYSKEA